jgi:hypothetical protein
MTLHVTALFIHTIVMIFTQVVTVVTFIHPSPKNNKWINATRIILYFSNSVSQAIVIYLFVQFATPVTLKKEEDTDYEEEFDRARDPNLDMMYYVKSMPKMKHTRKEDYEIDTSKGVAEQLFDSRDEEVQFTEEEDILEQDAKIDGFTDRMTNKWGEEETQLRLAIYISFVKDADTLMFRKKVKERRMSLVTSIRLSASGRMPGAINADEDQRRVSLTGKTARRVS